MKNNHHKSKKILADILREEREHLHQAEAEYFMKNLDIGIILDDVDVDVDERRIVWPDGKKLSTIQSAKRIQKRTGIELQIITSNIIAWLQMDYVPNELEEFQMATYENKIEEWIVDIENGIQDS